MSKAQSPPKFNVDDTVRVQRGVTDPDFDDVAIGGWAGAIAEVHHLNPPMYLVRWSQHTHDNIHPVYRNRCDQEGFDNEEMWLAEDDLESDTGEPVEIEQPTNIEQPANMVTRPLSLDDQDHRIRLALGLTGDDSLTKPGEATLLAYRKYLTANLVFPFGATYSSGPKRYPITVLDLLHLDAFPEDEDGLFCNARRENEHIMLPLIDLEVEGDNPNRRLIDDYSAWFVNW